MSRCLRHARFKLNVSREKFSEMLMMDTRSYYDLEEGRSAPNGLTLALYLALLCDNVPGFIDDMYALIAEATK